MIQLVLQPLWHKGNTVIGIYYANNTMLNSIVKQLPGAKWTQTHKCWYLPYSNDAYHQLQLAVRAIASIDSQFIKNIAKPLTASATSVAQLPASINQVPTRNAALLKIYSENAHVLPKMQQNYN